MRTIREGIKYTYYVIIFDNLATKDL